MRTIQRNIVGAFIFSSDGKILLGKSYKGGVYKDLWIVPGGGIDEGETAYEAVKRETLEETGIDVAGARIDEFGDVLTGESEKVLRDTGEKVLVKMKFHDFKIQLSKSAELIELRTDEDFGDARWFSPKELKGLQLSPPTITNLKELGLL